MLHRVVQVGRTLRRAAGTVERLEDHPQAVRQAELVEALGENLRVARAINPPLARGRARCHRPRTERRRIVGYPSAPFRTVRPMSETHLRVSNDELATVREAMRVLNQLLDRLDRREVDKIVLTQRNQMRAVVITPERYSELEQAGSAHT